MAYPGLAYPTDEKLLESYKNSGQFILVDINQPITTIINPRTVYPIGRGNPYTTIPYIFIFGLNIAGTRQNIIDALYLMGYEVDQIGQIMSSGIDRNNYMTDSAQQWLEIFQQQIANPRPVQSVLVPLPRSPPTQMPRSPPTQMPRSPPTQMPRSPPIQMPAPQLLFPPKQDVRFQPKARDTLQETLTKIDRARYEGKTYQVGDIITYMGKGGMITGRIRKINPKTYDIGEYRVARDAVRPAFEHEIQKFLNDPKNRVPDNGRADFYIGQTVQFTQTRTKQVETGVITKLNQERANVLVDGRNIQVPYIMLTPYQ
jgi:hypothetical protein